MFCIRNRISKDCSSRMKCLRCGHQHHVIICTSDANNEVQSLHTPNVEGLASLPQSPTSHNPPRKSSGRPTVLYVNASTPILLQTAKAAIYRPGQPNETFLARLILHSGSQRSYVTTTVKDKLRLPSERKQTISGKTFGSTEENTQNVWTLFSCVSVLSMEMTYSCEHLLCPSSAILYRTNPLNMPMLLMHT